MKKCSKNAFRQSALWLDRTSHILIAETRDGVSFNIDGHITAEMLLSVMFTHRGFANKLLDAADAYVSNQERVAAN